MLDAGAGRRGLAVCQFGGLSVWRFVSLALCRFVRFAAYRRTPLASLSLTHPCEALVAVWLQLLLLPRLQQQPLHLV